MKKDKFLTVYAVLDQNTQDILQALQNKILKKYPNGTQTMNIPFHISLGSFPLEEKNTLIRRIGDVIEQTDSFEIKIEGLDHFGYSVIFAVPQENKDVTRLHEIFNGNYSDGYAWHPHITLYCGTKEEGEKILKEFSFSSINAHIVGIQLGEFFPTKIILDSKF